GGRCHRPGRGTPVRGRRRAGGLRGGSAAHPDRAGQPGRLRRRPAAPRRRRGRRARLAVRLLHAHLVPAQRLRRASAAGWAAAAGAGAPPRAGARGAARGGAPGGGGGRGGGGGGGPAPPPAPPPPIGNGRAITVLAAREGASVVCADRDQAAAETTAALARA